MGQEKTWNDQPDVVAEARVIGTVWIHVSSDENRAVEIRRRDQEVGAIGVPIYYLTCGNLFGSQTFRCEGAVCALEMLACMDRIRKTNQLPGGVSVLENS